MGVSVYLKKLFSGYSAVQDALTSVQATAVEGDAYLYFLEEKFNFYKDVVSYVVSCGWLKRRRTKEVMLAFITHGCDTNKTIEHLGLSADKDSVNRVRSMISTASASLEKKLGESFFLDLNASSDVDRLSELKYTFSVATGTFSVRGLFLNEFSALMPKAEDNDVALSTAEMELKALRQYTKWFMSSRVVGSLSAEKFAKILFVLTDISYAESNARYTILNYLSGKVTDIDRVIEVLESLER